MVVQRDDVRTVPECAEAALRNSKPELASAEAA
jgi:hypothetical protein